MPKSALASKVNFYASAALIAVFGAFMVIVIFNAAKIDNPIADMIAHAGAIEHAE